MTRSSVLAVLALLAVSVGILAASSAPHGVTPALAHAPHHAAAANSCPQYGYAHPYCATVPNGGCFQVHVIGKPITLESCEPKNGPDVGRHITTNPTSNPCPTVPNGPQYAGSFVLHADGSFPPLHLQTPPPPGGKLYHVTPPGGHTCVSITHVAHLGEYEVVYPHAHLAQSGNYLTTHA